MSNNLVKVLVQASNEEGKENALKCAKVPIMGNPDPTIIKMSAGFIIGMFICESDKQELLQAPGIVNVEDDHEMSIAKGIEL